MPRADRLFQLVQLLRSRKVATAARLAAELGVSPRTVYRDVRDLEAAGVPIEGEAGVGYRLARGFDLPPLTFHAEEIEALVLGARMVQSWGDPALAAAARTALAKVEEVLPIPLRHLVAQTALFAPSWSSDATGHVGTLRRAISGRAKLRVVYTSREGERTERVLWPLGLYFWGRVWSLAAWCELRDGYRNFRPDRIERITVLTERFEPGAAVSLQGFVEEMEARHRQR